MQHAGDQREKNHTDEGSQRREPLASDTTQGARGVEPGPRTDLWHNDAVQLALLLQNHRLT